nr:hypothetical protein [Tanacetum cinerariifolium]
MSDTIRKALDAAELANVTVAAKPTRKIRSEQVKQLERRKVSTDATHSGPSEESALGIDKYELVDSQEQTQYTGSESVYQEQNKKRKHHTGSQYGFRHFLKSEWGEDDEEEDLET